MDPTSGLSLLSYSPLPLSSGEHAAQRYRIYIWVFNTVIIQGSDKPDVFFDWYHAFAWIVLQGRGVRERGDGDRGEMERNNCQWDYVNVSAWQACYCSSYYLFNSGFGMSSSDVNHKWNIHPQWLWLHTSMNSTILSAGKNFAFVKRCLQAHAVADHECLWPAQVLWYILQTTI
jgi:hypothetical protein